MAKTRTASRQARTTLVGQLGVSITATVAATLIVTGLQHEMAALRPLAASPERTSGGKFAARVEALRVAAEDVEPNVVAPVRGMPLLVPDAAFHDVMLFPDRNENRPAFRPASDPAKAVKRVVHVDARHRMLAYADIDVMPPKRSDSLAAEVGLVAEPDVQAGHGGVLRSTERLYRKALWFGGSLLDLVNPVNLLP